MIMSPGLCRGRTRTGSYRGGTVDITPIGRDGATDIVADGTRPGTEPIRRLGVVARRSRQRVSRPDAGGALVLEPAE